MYIAGNYMCNGHTFTFQRAKISTFLFSAKLGCGKIVLFFALQPNFGEIAYLFRFLCIDTLLRNQPFCLLFDFNFLSDFFEF